MDVILLEKVDNLGNIGDQVTVRSGYGRNYLLPKGKATLATAENIAELEARRPNWRPARPRNLRARKPVQPNWMCSASPSMPGPGSKVSSLAQSVPQILLKRLPKPVIR